MKLCQQGAPRQHVIIPTSVTGKLSRVSDGHSSRTRYNWAGRYRAPHALEGATNTKIIGPWGHIYYTHIYHYLLFISFYFVLSFFI